MKPDAKIGVVIWRSGRQPTGGVTCKPVDGNVQALVDTQTAIRFGAAFEQFWLFPAVEALIGGR